jgi:amino acid transporter
MGDSKPFGSWTLALLVMANMIGAGVFTTSGFTLADLGSPRLVILAWFMAGLVAWAGAISYGQLIRTLPESGGEYLFLSRLAHPMLGFIAGWVSLIAGFTGAIAFAATAMETYLVPADHRPAWLPHDLLAVTAVVLAGVCHGLSASKGALFQNAAVLLKLLLLVAFLVVAAMLPGNQWQGGPLPGFTATNLDLVLAFATSLVWISLSYSGFNAAVYVAGEVEDARRLVPRALVMGTLATAALYLMLNGLFMFAPPPEQVSGAPDIAAATATAIGGNLFGVFIRLIIALALLTSVMSMMMAAPRVYAKMADDGLLPKALSFAGNEPRAAVMLQVGLAIVIILVSSLRGLLSYLGLTLSLCAAGSVSCLLVPRIRHEWKITSSRRAPGVYVFCTLSAAAIMAVNEPTQCLAAGATFVTGALIYVIASRGGAR